MNPPKAANFVPPCRGNRAIRISILFAFTLAGVIRAQTPETMPQRGVVPMGSYSVGDLETVNVVTGNLLYQIPLTKLAPSRAGLTVGLNLTYNSSIYDIAQDTEYSQSGQTNAVFSKLVASQWGGWQYGYTYSLDLEIRQTLNNAHYCPGTPDNWKIYRLSVIFPDGSHHTLHLYPGTTSIPAGQTYSDYNGDGYYEVDPAGNTLFPHSVCSAEAPATGDLTYYTTDGTYVKVVFNSANWQSTESWGQRGWTIYLPDGRTVTGYGSQASFLVDRNGNQISIQNVSYQGVPSTLLTSYGGIQILIQHQLYGGLPVSDTITQTAPTGETLTWTVNWTTFSLLGSPLGYYCSPYQDSCPANVQQTVVSSVSLPTPSDGLPENYSFGYSKNDSVVLGQPVPGWGQMNTVILPSGATAVYTYYFDGSNMFQGTLLDNPITKKALTWTDDADSSQHTDTWLYNLDFASPGQITNPDGGVVSYYVDTAANQRLVFEITQPDGARIERTWQRNRPLGSDPLYPDPANPYVKYEFRSVASAGTPVLAGVRSFSYDKNGNQTQLSEYDWIPYSSILRDSSGRASGFSNASPTRTSATTYTVTTATAGDGSEAIVDDPNAYWRESSPQFRSLAARNVVSGTGPGAVAEYSYDGHGNVTQERHWDSIKASTQPASLNSSNSTVTSYFYDSYGNLTQITNGRGYNTTFVNDNDGHVTQMVQAANTPDARTFTYVRDAYHWGLAASETDVDHGATRTYFYDKFGRTTFVNEANLQVTSTSYFDHDRRIVVTRDLYNQSASTQTLVSGTWYDQLGRVWKTKQMEQGTDSVTDDNKGIKVVTRRQTPAGGGFSYLAVSNPYVSGSETTAGWTRSTFDKNGRVVAVQHFSGSTLPSPWGSNTNSSGTATTSYTSNQTTPRTRDWWRPGRKPEMVWAG